MLQGWCGLGRLVELFRIENFKPDTSVKLDCCSIASKDFKKDDGGLRIERPRKRLIGVLGSGLERRGSVQMGMNGRTDNEVNGIFNNFLGDTITPPFRPDPKAYDKPYVGSRAKESVWQCWHG